MSTDFGLLLTVNGNPVSFGPNEAAKGINNIAAWGLLEPKSYKLTKPVEIGSASNLAVFLEAEFGVASEPGKPGILEQINDSLPPVLGDVARKLESLVLTIEEFEINIPAHAKVRTIKPIADLTTKKEIYDYADVKKISGFIAEARDVISKKTPNKTTTETNPFEIITDENLLKTSYKLSLTLQWKDEPISFGSSFKLNGIYLKIDSES